MKHLLIYTTLALLMFAVSCKSGQHARKSQHHKTVVKEDCHCGQF